MAEVNRPNSEGNMSLDDFMRNMPPELQVLDRAWDSLHQTTYAVFHQSQTSGDISGSSRISCSVKERIEMALMMFQNRVNKSESNLVKFWAMHREAEMMQSDQPSVPNGPNIGILQKDGDLTAAEMIQSGQFIVANALQKGVDEIAPLDNGQTVNYAETEVIITRKVLEQHAVAKLKLVARHLQVSTSTFKRICRKYGIRNWLSFRKAMVKRMHPDSLEAAEEHIKHRYCRTGDQDFSQLKDNMSSGEIVESNSIPKIPIIHNGNCVTVTVKASYEGDMIRFKFSLFVPKFADLVEKIAKRFSFQANSFKIKYEDEDDDLILLATDEDLRNIMSSVKSVRKNRVYLKIENLCNIAC